MDTLELRIDLNPKDPWSDILIAELAENGFDSFMNTDTGILAYGEAGLDLDTILSQTILHSSTDFEFTLHKEIIPHQNWNAQWEASFNPVYIEEYASILAPFHDRQLGNGMIVEILPQMSFGTGHHQTTWMMTKALFELGKMPEKVLDMGSGTGVLAIVAEKLGAEDILAIDIEDWSAKNAAENAERNGCVRIKSVCGDIDLIKGKTFGLVIANINKNILKSHMKSYAESLEKDGILLLSGFFDSDVNELVDFAAPFNLTKTKVFNKDEWACIQLQKSNN